MTRHNIAKLASAVYYSSAESTSKMSCISGTSHSPRSTQEYIQFPPFSTTVHPPYCVKQRSSTGFNSDQCLIWIPIRLCKRKVANSKGLRPQLLTKGASSNLFAIMFSFESSSRISGQRPESCPCFNDVSIHSLRPLGSPKYPGRTAGRVIHGGPIPIPEQNCFTKGDIDVSSGRKPLLTPNFLPASPVGSDKKSISIVPPVIVAVVAVVGKSRRFAISLH